MSAELPGPELPGMSRQFVGEILGITDAEDLRRGVVPEAPGRKGDKANSDFR
jgi:hypothetical protein